MQLEKLMPNAIIATGMAIFIGSAHLHHRQDNEVEDVVAIEGITEADVDDVEEDVVGDNRGPQRNPAHAALIASGIRWART